MNKQSKFTGGLPLSANGATDIIPSVPRPVGGADAPNASTYSATLCPQCGREAHRCMCPWPGDEDMMPATEVCRIMDEFNGIREARERFEAGDPDSGWALAERSAYGMGGSR